MSSVNWQKIRSAPEVVAKVKHNDIEQRLQANHSNADINKDLTSQNLSLDGRSLRDKIDTYNQLVNQSKKTMVRVRSNAITCIGLNVKIPEDLTYAPRELQEDWIYNAYDVIRDYIGENRIFSATADFDEVHAYVDPETHETVLSRPELDVKFVPSDPETGHLNAAGWQTRAKMREINNAIEQMSMEQYNIRFMTGKSAKRTDVDVLKKQSIEAEAKLLEAKRKENLKDLDYIMRCNEQLIADTAKLDEREKRVDASEADLVEREKKVDEREKVLKDKAEALERVRADLERDRQAFTQKVDEAVERRLLAYQKDAARKAEIEAERTARLDCLSSSK